MRGLRFKVGDVCRLMPGNILVRVVRVDDRDGRPRYNVWDWHRGPDARIWEDIDHLWLFPSSVVDALAALVKTQGVRRGPSRAFYRTEGGVVDPVVESIAATAVAALLREHGDRQFETEADLLAWADAQLERYVKRLVEQARSGTN